MICTMQVQINTYEHKCALTLRVSRMATQAWVADRVYADLKKKPSIGVKEL